MKCDTHMQEISERGHNNLQVSPMKCIFYLSHMSTVTDDRKFTKKSFLVRPETTVRRKKIKTEKKRKKNSKKKGSYKDLYVTRKCNMARFCI